MNWFLLLIIMATTYFVEPGIGNDANAGTSQGAGNSWATIQKAADTAVAGDTVKCIGTETLTITVDWDINAGSVASGLIKFIGVNSSGVNDGTMYVMDGNSAAANAIKITNKAFLYFENIEIKNTTSHGMLIATDGDNNLFVNCWAHNCGGSGFNPAGLPFSINFYRCRAYSNTGSGFLTLYGGNISFSEAYSNTASGATYQTGSPVIYCNLFYSNTTSGVTTGIAGSGLMSPIFGNTLNNNATGIIVGSTKQVAYIIGNRLTNNATAGISLAAAKCAYEDYNAYGGNGTDKSVNASAVLTSGGNSQTGITIGYNNAAGADFNLTSSATLRRTAINIDSTNIYYVTAGLVPTDSGGSSSSGGIIVYDD